MRTLRRRFSPQADALEGRNAVSSLSLWLAESFETAMPARQEDFVADTKPSASSLRAAEAIVQPWRGSEFAARAAEAGPAVIVDGAASWPAPAKPATAETPQSDVPLLFAAPPLFAAAEPLGVVDVPIIARATASPSLSAPATPAQAQGAPGSIRPYSMAPSAPATHSAGQQGVGAMFGIGGMATQGASGGSGGGTPTMADTADPYVVASGGGTLIGGNASFVVFNVGNETFKSVTWTVSGGQMQSQSYTLPSGTTTALASPIVHQPSADDYWDHLGFYWGSTAGNYTVTALITYTDMSSESVSTSVTVVEPTVGAYDVSVAAATLANLNGVPNGMMTLQSPGIQYTATVSVPANTEGGEFAFLQKANVQVTQNNATTGVHTMNTGFVLDNWTGSGSAFMIQGKTFNVAAGATVSTPSRTDNPGPPSDNAPQVWYRGWANDLNTGYSASDQFQTYLMFRPSGGIWVKLSETAAYGFSGSATWVPTDPAKPSVGRFEGTVSISTASPTTTNGTGFVNWTDYWTSKSDLQRYVPAY